MPSHKLDLNGQIQFLLSEDGDERELTALRFLVSLLHPWLPASFARGSVGAYHFFTISSVNTELNSLHRYASTKPYRKFCRDGSNISTFIYKYHKKMDSS